MADIYVSTLGVPKVPRNKRIYGGDFRVQYNSIGAPVSTTPTIPNVQANILKYDDGDFATRTITVEFITPFLDIPVGWVKAYRYEARSGGGYFETNAVFYYSGLDWLTKVGFEIIVEDYESLTGLIIEFNYHERTDQEE